MKSPVLFLLVKNTIIKFHKSTLILNYENVLFSYPNVPPKTTVLTRFENFITYTNTCICQAETVRNKENIMIFDFPYILI